MGGEGLSPACLRLVVGQGGRYAFEEAAYNLRALAGIQISRQHTLRLTERVGREWQALRDWEVAEFEQGRLARTYGQRPVRAAVILDGGRAQTRAEQSPPGVRDPAWREPKYACLLTLEGQVHAQDPQPAPPKKFTDREGVPKLVRSMQRVRAEAQGREAPVGAARRRRRKKAKRARRHLVRTVVATMAAVREFGQQVAVEVHKRGLDLAEWKACVCDGQASNWTVYEQHLKRHGFVAVLDFLHLLTYLYPAAQAAGGTAEARWARYVEWMTWAWLGRRDKVLVALNAACAKAGEPAKDTPETDPRAVLARTRTYVTNNADKMDYPRYRMKGLPISSAPVESLIKQFNKRVKGTEKFWRPSALEAVLQVRAAQLSEDGREDRLWANPRPPRAPRPRKVPSAA